ncbi:RFIP1 protein, partial [Urocolius indicus]|nr:RFIP1 protein [Urocolius indicus]
CRAEPSRAAMSIPAPGWVPTHVQVTVLRARGLRSKAASSSSGGSDAYTVMALGRDKFSTSVSERCQGQPVWREEATFELPPPPRAAALRLTVLHRALRGADKFLGRADVDLNALRDQGGRRHSRWYKLHSKPGKKEKERGEIEVDIQFMRSNMTASMFDLSMKDKSRSPFGKLKDKLKGKRSSGLSDTASAIVPSASRSPADSEDESVEKEKKKSKIKALFSKPGLQKTSLSQSMSVLPTQQPVSQRVRLRPSDFQPQWDDDESETSPTSEKKFSPSPLFISRKTATLDSRQPNQAATNHTKREGLSLFSGLKSKSDPVSKSSLCINGSHVYMEESTTKDSTPASSPSPHNFRRKQLFASEENLSFRSTKGPEETGGMSPSHAFSGSASLETFKSMTLPSYKLLSGEESLDSNFAPSLETVKETKKQEHKKSALLSLVTGKKEAAKTNDAENIPNKTLQDEDNRVLEEKSEQEAKQLELPSAVSRENPPEDRQGAGDVFPSKQSLNPFEEEWKPEKAAAPAKTKAVRPRLGVTSEEETKAKLPTLAPDSLPALLSVHLTRSDNNPFLSKGKQSVRVPGSDSVAGSPASLTSAFAAELLNGKNPFAPQWDGAAAALEPEGHAHFPSSHHSAASVPKAPLLGQVSGSANNPFSSAWGQGPEGSDTWAARGLSPPSAPSQPSEHQLDDSNPFVAKLGWEADAAGCKAVVGSSPSCLPPDGGCSSAQHPAELRRSGCAAPGSSSDLALTNHVKAVSNPLSTLSDPALAPAKQCPAPQAEALERSELGKRGSAEQPPSPEREMEEQESFGEKRRGEAAPTLEPQTAPLDENDSFSQVRAGRGRVGALTASPGDARAGRAAGEVAVPTPAPRLFSLRNSPQVSQADGFSGEEPFSAEGVKPVPGLPAADEEASDAGGCLPQPVSSEPTAPPATLSRGSSTRRLRQGGDAELFEHLTSLKPAVPIAADHGSKLASLPVILEGGSDDELLGECQESHGVTAGDKHGSETAKRPLNVTVPLHGELKEHSDGSAAAQETLVAPGGGGSAAGACKAGHSPVPPARAAVHSVRRQGAGSGVGTTSPPRDSIEEQELKTSAGVEECAECDFSEPSVSSSSSSSPSQPYSFSHPLLSDTLSHRAESPKKPRAEGFAAKAGDSGKKKLLQAWVSPSETYPNQTQQGGESLAPKHRPHPVKPMNATANKAPSKNLNVISTMSEKLLEANVKRYDPADPAYAYAQLTHDELIQLVLKQKDTISKKDLQVRELEDYIDNLLVRVMEQTPNILRVSTSGNKKAGKM